MQCGQIHDLGVEVQLEGPDPKDRCGVGLADVALPYGTVNFFIC